MPSQSLSNANLTNWIPLAAKKASCSAHGLNQSNVLYPAILGESIESTELAKEPVMCRIDGSIWCHKVSRSASCGFMLELLFICFRSLLQARYCSCSLPISLSPTDSSHQSCEIYIVCVSLFFFPSRSIFMEKTDHLSCRPSPKVPESTNAMTAALPCWLPERVLCRALL